MNNLDISTKHFETSYIIAMINELMHMKLTDSDWNKLKLNYMMQSIIANLACQLYAVNRFNVPKEVIFEKRLDMNTILIRVISMSDYMVCYEIDEYELEQYDSKE